MGSPARAARGAIGGASGDAGVEYRRAVAAYAVAHGLAGDPLPGFGVPRAEAQVSAVSLETDDAVDDVAVEFDSGWRATVQARRTVRKGEPFASAVAQWRGAAVAGIDPVHERLVLVTASMPEWMQALQAVLDRLKTDRPGGLTVLEGKALAYLNSLLPGLTPSQREAVYKSAAIRLLLVEEAEEQDASQAVNLLGDVFGRRASVKAWHDLVRLAGRAARRRGGFTMSGWLELLQGEGNQVIGDETTAARLARDHAARERYLSQIRRCGGWVDLRPLGAALPPLRVADVDAGIGVLVPGDDQRESRSLLWAFMRRGRMLLTGLPGGGKSTAIAMTAARMADVPHCAVPVVASLRDIDRGDRSASFRDRLLDVAVRDLSEQDRPFVRGWLERLLESGGVALFLDSLDETRSRRGKVMRELHDFLSGISPDADVLLATRDVAYAQAATLGWPEVRLGPPGDIEKLVRAILDAAAAGKNQSGQGDWVDRRADWVDAALERDGTLRETPLLPVLLALLASEKATSVLPRHRASILAAVIKNVAERYESQRGEDFRIGEFQGQEAVAVAIEGFAAEAAEIGAAGGQCPLPQAIRAVARVLTDRWGVHAGPAETTADAIARFWDEAGILVLSGADETLAPRVEIYAEIGEAIRITQGTEAEIIHWVDVASSAGRYESVILAAGLSSIAARRLLQVASVRGSQDLLMAATTAVREGAAVAEEELTALACALADDVRIGDREAWRTWSRLARLPLTGDMAALAESALTSFPPEYQAIGRAVIILREMTSADSLTPDETAQLLDALRVTKLQRLGRRERRRSFSDIAVDENFTEAKQGAADALLGTVDEATPLVIDSLHHGSIGMQQNLINLCQRRGFTNEANDALREQTQLWQKSMANFLNFDRDAHKTLLSHLCREPGAELGYQQKARLSELADFCETLSLNEASAWPRQDDDLGDFRSLLTLVGQLGRFDPAVLSAEARITLERMGECGDEAFFALFDEATERDLDDWDEVPDRQAAVKLLVRTLFHGESTAWVAARALWGAPVAELAVPLLRAALPQLESSTEHQRIAALTLSSLTNDDEIRQWASNPNPVLRRVSAHKIKLESNGHLTPEMRSLLDDQDGHVVETAVERFEEEKITYETRTELLRISASPSPGWMCLHCRTHNEPGRSSCRQCHVVGPESSRKAAEILGRGWAATLSYLQRRRESFRRQEMS